jgi:hypothetical protein
MASEFNAGDRKLRKKENFRLARAVAPSGSHQVLNALKY